MVVPRVHHAWGNAGLGLQVASVFCRARGDLGRHDALGASGSAGPRPGSVSLDQGEMSHFASDQPEAPGPLTIRVAVGDERRMIAEALAALIETMSGFAVTAVLTGEAGVRTLVAQPPDLVLAGVAPGTDAGFDLVRSIRAQLPEVQIVIVADALQPNVVRLVFDQQLGGLLLTDMSAPYIATSLDEVAHGRAVLPVGWQQMLSHEPEDTLECLSQRQMDVLKLLADGLSYEEIGTRLFITVNTVKFHVRSIFARLGVGNRTTAARVFAERAGAEQGRSHTAT
jgi:two-component system, NarL family, response regulator LiaR